MMNSFEKMVAEYNEPTTHRAFPAMVAAYETVVGMKTWGNMGRLVVTDLNIHDHRRLHGDDVPPIFGWCLSSGGTLLLDPRMGVRDMAGYLDHIKRWATDTYSKHRYFFWDGRKLSRVRDNAGFCRRMSEASRTIDPRSQVSSAY